MGSSISTATRNPERYDGAVRRRTFGGSIVRKFDRLLLAPAGTFPPRDGGWPGVPNAHAAGRPSIDTVLDCRVYRSQVSETHRGSGELNREEIAVRKLYSLQQEIRSLPSPLLVKLTTVTAFRARELTAATREPMVVLAYLAMTRPLETLGISLKHLPKFLYLLGGVATTRLYHRLNMMQFLYSQLVNPKGVLHAFGKSHPTSALALYVATLALHLRSRKKHYTSLYDQGTAGHRPQSDVEGISAVLCEHQFFQDMPQPIRNSVLQSTKDALIATEPWMLECLEHRASHADFAMHGTPKAIIQASMVVASCSMIFRNEKCKESWLKHAIDELRVRSDHSQEAPALLFEPGAINSLEFIQAHDVFVTKVFYPFVKMWMTQATSGTAGPQHQHAVLDSETLSILRRATLTIQDASSKSKHHNEEVNNVQHVSALPFEYPSLPGDCCTKAFPATTEQSNGFLPIYLVGQVYGIQLKESGKWNGPDNGGDSLPTGDIA